MKKKYITDCAYPDYNFDKITDITPADLKIMGVKTVAIDLDNTTVPYSSLRLEKGVKKWIDEMRENGIKVIIVTNALIGRSFILSKKMGNIPFIPLAFKPSPVALRIASFFLDVENEEMAMIGDQLFTDVLAANRLGAVSVKVEPLGEDGWLFKRYFKTKRELELLYLRNFENPSGEILQQA